MQQDLQYSTKVKTNLVQIIKLSLPIALSVLIPQINFATNTFFLQKLGENYIAANAVAGIFYLILSTVCFGFCNGMQVILSRRAGQGNKSGMLKVFSNGLQLGLLFCLFLMIASWYIAPIIFDNFIHNYNIKHLAKEFIAYRIWGLPFLFLQQASIQYLISIKKSKYILLGTIASTILNIALDYWLILGTESIPSMGMRGAAIASIGAEFLFMFLNFSLLFRKGWLKNLAKEVFAPINKTLCKEMIGLSAPIVLQYFFSIASWQLFFIFVEHLGSTELSISQILRSVFGIVGCTSWALASTSNAMVSNLIGQERKNEIIPLIKRICKLSLAASAVSSAVILYLPHVFLGMYGIQGDILLKALPALYMVICSNLLLSLSTIVFNSVLGIGNTKINLMIELAAISGYIIYCIFIIEKMRMPLVYAWGSEIVYWGIILVLSIYFLKKGKWKSYATF